MSFFSSRKDSETASKINSINQQSCIPCPSIRTEHEEPSLCQAGHQVLKGREVRNYQYHNDLAFSRGRERGKQILDNVTNTIIDI